MAGAIGLEAAMLEGARKGADGNVLAERLDDVGSKLGELGTALDGVTGRISDQAVILQSLDGLAETVDELIKRFNAIFPPDDPSTGFYSPIPTPRFWLPHGEDRAKTIATPRASREQACKPEFRHLPTSRPHCRAPH